MATPVDVAVAHWAGEAVMGITVAKVTASAMADTVAMVEVTATVAVEVMATE